jgi:hypothetical protein
MRYVLLALLLGGCAGWSERMKAADTPPPASADAPYGYSRGMTCLPLGGYNWTCYPDGWVKRVGPSSQGSFTEPRP